jgi:hypothetical protein
VAAAAAAAAASLSAVRGSASGERRGGKVAGFPAAPGPHCLGDGVPRRSADSKVHGAGAARRVGVSTLGVVWPVEERAGLAPALPPRATTSSRSCGREEGREVIRNAGGVQCNEPVWRWAVGGLGSLRLYLFTIKRGAGSHLLNV